MMKTNENKLQELIQIEELEGKVAPSAGQAINPFIGPDTIVWDEL